MKKYSAILLLMVFVFNICGQQVKVAEQRSEVDYLKKSRKARNTGLILLGGGAAMFLGGAYLTEHGCSCKDPTGILLMLGGTTMAAVSIPFFISSAGNKRKAKLYMNKEALILAPKIKTGIVHHSIGVKIDL